MNIFITGSESTGKSTLTRQLSEHFGVPCIPEFARYYISSLHRDYTLADLEIIGKKQIDQIEKNKQTDLVFFDTGLIVTCVWFQHKYRHIPQWLLSAIPNSGLGKYLICEPDIPWAQDSVRENPNLREELHGLYIKMIQDQGFSLGFVRGHGIARLNNAIEIVEDWIFHKEPN